MTIGDGKSSLDLSKLIGFLLGDPGRTNPRIDEWLKALMNEQRIAAAQETSSPQLPSPILTFHELGCAQLHDSRLEEASVTFKNLRFFSVAATPLAATGTVLWRLGFGRAMTLLRKYSLADHAFTGAIKAARSADPALLYLAELFQATNRSDWGHEIDTAAIQDLPVGLPANLGLLIATARTLTLGKIMLRRGARREGLHLLDEFVSVNPIGELPPIPRGSIFRLRGIFLAMCGRAPAARSELERAICVFRDGGYQLGEVQAAMSLARATARADRQLTWHYLDKARLILEATDHPGAHAPEGRQMPAERADLFARLADFKFATGDFREALELYEKDLETLQALTGEPGSAMPRAAGYAHRNLGRVLVALGESERAREHLTKSCELFQQVNDGMNVFFSAALECEAALAANDVTAASTRLTLMDELIAEAPDRLKERAIIHTLRAQIVSHEDLADAIAMASTARIQLQSFRDYYFVRALLVEAEILVRMNDVGQAKQKLKEARGCAMDNEVEDLRLLAEARLSRLGLRKNELTDRRRTALRARCDQAGFVQTDLVTLFADIRGFTAASTRIPADSMAMFIREFAQLLGKCTSRHGGDPVRFLGDCVMALFTNESSPLSSASLPETRAIEAAAEIHGLFSNLRERWSRALPELKPLGLGFGISTGTVIAGTFGTEELSEFSAIGEPVNLAARLQSMAGNGEIVVCRDTFLSVQQHYLSLPSEERRADLKGLGAVIAYALQVQDVLQAAAAEGVWKSHPKQERAVPAQSGVPPLLEDAEEQPATVNALRNRQ